MEIRFTIVHAPTGARADVAVTSAARPSASGGATTGPQHPTPDAAQLAAWARDVLGLPPAQPVQLCANGRRVPDHLPVGAAPLLHGAVLTLAPAAHTRRGDEPSPLLELHVAAGPDAGRVHPLGPGRHEIGRGAGVAVGLDDPDLSRRHAVLEVDRYGVSVADLGSSNGTAVDGRPVREQPVAITPASRLRVGSTTLLLRIPDALPATTASGEDGRVAVNVPPRLREPVPDVEVRLPAAPQPRPPARIPVLTLVLPLVVAVPLAVWLSPVFLLFALLSPVMALATVLGDRRSAAADLRRARADHDREIARLEAQVCGALAAEAARRRAACPDAGELLGTATGPGLRLWERRAGDPDVLLLRLGTRTLPSAVRVVDESPGAAPRAPDVDDVPVAVSLADVGVLGVAGPRARACGLVRFLLAQAAVCHRPRDLTIVVLADASAGTATPWSWVTWLPHARSTRDHPDDGSVLVAVTPEQVTRRVGELLAVVRHRRTERPDLADPARRGGVRAVGDAARGERWTGPRTLLLLDGAHRLRDVPGVAELLQHGPSVGVSVLCLDLDGGRLPVECAATAEVGGDAATRLRLSVDGQPPLDDVVVDAVSAGWAERVGRALAPLVESGPAAAGGDLPQRARLLELLDVDATDPDAVLAGWRRAHPQVSPVLGVGAAGPHRVDLRRDGPHALVAGTTGAGKSELLQTLVAALAVQAPPHEVAFVLVDYKGGAAFAECARLPHVLGLVTDLDARLTERALRSLGAELARRERLFARAGVADLDGYRAAASPQDPPVPRLVLVIDEFRALAEELPDFVTGLVRVASLGRSLGVHLVLATQRPGGVVAADIRANVNLRIALRVRDTAESADVLDLPDAARIGTDTPGRALIRSAAGPPHHVQVARVAGAGPAPTPAPRFRVLAGAAAGNPAPDADAPGPPTRSDLARLVEAVTAASEALDLPRPSSPWLPPLPDVVTLDDLHEGAAPKNHVRAVLGLADLPAQQAQRALTWSPRDGHLAVVGSARSGRTSALRALAASLARGSSPSDVHLHAIDCASGALLPVAGLPHAGTVVGRTDVARAARLVARLEQELERRQSLLAAAGFAGAAEQRLCAPPDERLPYVVLLVDGWEALRRAVDEVDGGRTHEALERLLREGAGPGLAVVVSGGRTLLGSTAFACVQQSLVLRLSDPTDLLMAGVARADIPLRMPPGRALWLSGAADGDHTADAGPHRAGPVEVQVALLDADPSGPAQVSALAGLARAARSAESADPAPRRPLRLEPLPGRVSLSAVTAHPHLPDAEKISPPGATWLPVGLGGDDGRPVGVPLGGPVPAVLLTGPAGSGRTTALRTVAAALTRQGRAYTVVRPRPGPPVEGLLTAPLGTFTVGQAADLEQALRTGAAPPPSAVAGRMPTGAAAPGPGPAPVVLVDDAELLSGTDVEDVLLSYLRDAEQASGAALVVAGLTADLAVQYRGLGVAVRRHRCGLVLSPSSPADADLLGARVGALERPRPGRGLLVTPTGTTWVQVAVPDASSPAAADSQAAAPQAAVRQLDPTPATTEARDVPHHAVMSLPVVAQRERAAQRLGRPA